MRAECQNAIGKQLKKVGNDVNRTGAGNQVFHASSTWCNKVLTMQSCSSLNSASINLQWQIQQKLYELNAHDPPKALYE